jgi:hypothetical protein
MKIVTLVTHRRHPAFKEFLEPSCKFYRLKLTIAKHNGEYSSHRLKDIVLNTFLQSLPENEIVFFTDAYDTIFLANQDEILEKFNAFNSPLVFSAEVNCWPSNDLIPHYPVSNSCFKYLNSGGFIGVAGYLVELYRKYPSFFVDFNPKFNGSNQYYWHNIYLQNVDKIKLDHDCRIFYNTSTLWEKIIKLNFKVKENTQVEQLFLEEKKRLGQEIEFVGNRIKNTLTGTFPCHLHFPGPIPKMLMQDQYFSPIRPWNQLSLRKKILWNTYNSLNQLFRSAAKQPS